MLVPNISNSTANIARGAAALFKTLPQPSTCHNIVFGGARYHCQLVLVENPDAYAILQSEVQLELARGHTDNKLVDISPKTFLGVFRLQVHVLA
jgi:hypothetical protein